MAYIDFPIDPARLRFADASAYAALTGSLSFDEAAMRYREGRLSDHDWHAFRLMWEWSTSRFSSHNQEWAFQRLGYPALARRFERCKRLATRYVAERFAYCAVSP